MACCCRWDYSTIILEAIYVESMGIDTQTKSLGSLIRDIVEGGGGGGKLKLEPLRNMANMCDRLKPILCWQLLY